MIGLGLGITSRLRGGAFTPAALFAAGEQGVWFDPSPTTCFTDTAGTTPAQVGQAVALMLDKSKGLALGPELYSGQTPVIAGQGGTAGTLDWDAGTETFTLTAEGTTALVNPRARWPTNIIGVESGKTYRIKGKFSGDIHLIRRFGTSNENEIIGSLSGTQLTEIEFEGTTQVELNNVGVELTFRSDLGSGSVTIEELSVRELPGSHATQPVPVSRPILGRVPARGRVNLLQRTEEFDNAVWAKLGTTGSGLSFRETAADSVHRVQQSFPSTVLATDTYTVSLEIKGVGTNEAALWLFTTGANRVQARVNLVDGTLIQSGGVSGGILVEAHSELLSDGYVKLVLTGQRGAEGGNVITLYPTSGAVSYMGDPNVGLDIRNFQFELGSTATNYQRVTDQFDVTEAGQPDNFYLFHGGSGNPRWMQTPSIDFTGTDKMSVFAGVRKLSDAAVGTVFEASANAGANNGAFHIRAPSLADDGTYRLFVRGTSNVSMGVSGFPAPTSNVLSGRADIAADQAQFYIDGQLVFDESGLGSGNFGNYPLFTGSRAGTSTFFNGHIYSLIVRGALTDTPTIERTEKYVASKTAGVSL